MMAVLALICGTMSAQNNLLENGGFEEWDGNTPTNWVSSTSASSASLAKSTDAHSGTYAVTVASDAKYNKRLAYKELNLKAGTYNVEFYAKGGQVRPGYAPVENGSVGSYSYGNYATLSTTEWTKVEYTFTLAAAATINIVVMNPKTTEGKNVATDATIDDFSMTTTDGGIDTSVPVVDISNTPETAYTVAKAIELIEAGKDLGTKVYVKGKISSIKEVNTAEFGNATYNISDDGTTTSAQVTVFRGYYLDGAKFTEEEQINLGDEVVVYGKLKDYKGTKELDTANHLYSINGATAGVKNITVDQTVNAPAFNLAGQRVNAASKGIVVKNGKKFLNK